MACNLSVVLPAEDVLVRLGHEVSRHVADAGRHLRIYESGEVAEALYCLIRPAQAPRRALATGEGDEEGLGDLEVFVVVRALAAARELGEAAGRQIPGSRAEQNHQ